MPDITPVVLFRINPVGNEGTTEYVIPDPVTVGVLYAIEPFWVYTAEALE